MQGCSQGVSQGCSHLKIQLRENQLPSSLLGCWQHSVPCGLLDSTGRLQFCSDFWPEVTFHSLPCELLQYDSMFSMWVTQEGKRKKEHKAARANKMEVTVLDNFVEMILHHFCWILFIRRQSLSLGYTLGEGMTQQCEYQKAETIGNYIRRCLWHHAGDVPLGEDYPHLVQQRNDHMTCFDSGNLDRNDILY